MRFRYRFGSRLSIWLLAAFVVAAIVPSMAGAMSVQKIPGVEGARLTSVSCTASNACIAVGYRGSSTLAVQWDGKSWSVQSTPNVSVYGSKLSSVSCVASTYCVAVGVWHAGEESNPLVEVWNGVKWEIPETYLEDRFWTELRGVSCTSVDYCVAVGSTEVQATKKTKAVVYDWYGSPHPWLSEWSGPEGTRLYSVSCPTEVTEPCKAIGGSGVLASGTVLAVNGRGSSWSSAAMPEPEEALVSLQGVSCWAESALSESACQLAGWYLPPTKPLTESWNGSKWSLVSNFATKGNLYGISCSKETEWERLCFAVGIEGTKPLAEAMYVGEEGWGVQVAPTPEGSTKATLLGVSTPTNHWAVAVGYYLNSSGVEIPVAEAGL